MFNTLSKTQEDELNKTGKANCVTTVDKDSMVLDEFTIRILSKVELCRLQGFPDNYTQIAWRGKISDDCPDGPRYKAMGNSMAVPVMRWIGERINAVENIKSKQEEKL